MARKAFTLTDHQKRACEGTRNVLVRFESAVLGVGFYGENQNSVASLFPKSSAAL